MSSPEIRPYGSWPTPITSEAVVAAARTAVGVAIDGDDLWWAESRPDEGGRIAIVNRKGDVLGPPWNARTAVHEYGGGAWWVRDGILWFCDWTSQRIHRLGPGGDPEPITPEPEWPRALRYADGDVSPDGQSIICVEEVHSPDREAINRVVRLDAHKASRPEVVAEGCDFYANPRWGPDGQSVCWIEWDHPDMPWDGSRLVVGEEGRQRVVAGADQRESICQAVWAEDGSLWFSSDRSGFWSLYRWNGTETNEVVNTGRDIGFPLWVFGESCFALLDGDRLAFVESDGPFDQVVVREADGSLRRLDLDLAAISGLIGKGAHVWAVGGSPSKEYHVVSINTVSGELNVEVPPRDLPFDSSWFSVPALVEFPTAGGANAFGLFYRPTNPEYAGPQGERPPLLVLIHGGPTSSVAAVLRLGLQYWTSRGFAVIDVNYRGSTGHGRAYRQLLNGLWGVADVEDCVAAAQYLVDRGEVNKERLAIRGGSAGGFTTLAALSQHDVFAAGASHFGVADLKALATDTHKFESRYLDSLVGPWPEARVIYEDRSPINHVEAINVPLAAFQGLEDEVVPPEQSRVIVEALRSRGVPVAYVEFEGEQHGFRQAKNIRAALDGELSFYSQVFGFELSAREGIDPVAIENL